jgi:hypothetical protein
VHLRVAGVDTVFALGDITALDEPKRGSTAARTPNTGRAPGVSWQVVLVDNVGAHRPKRMYELITAAGCGSHGMRNDRERWRTSSGRVRWWSRCWSGTAAATCLHPRHEQVSSRPRTRLVSRASAPELGELPGKGSALVVTGSSGGRTQRRIHRIGAEHVLGVAIREDRLDAAAAGA